jgi:hypothetical protein
LPYRSTPDPLANALPHSFAYASANAFSDNITDTKPYVHADSLSHCISHSVPDTFPNPISDPSVHTWEIQGNATPVFLVSRREIQPNLQLAV